MIVSQWHRRDLSVDVQQHVSININNVIAYAFVVIGEEDDCVGKLNGVQFCNHLFGLGAWNGCFNTGTRRFSQDEVREALCILGELPE